MAVDLSVVITCHGTCPDLDVIIGCLETQRQYGKVGRSYKPVSGCPLDFEIIVSSDGEYEGNPTHRWKPYVKIVENPKEGGVGHHTRGPGIEAAEGDWIVLQNCDNLVVSGFMGTLSKHTLPSVGVLYWDCVNSLWHYRTNGGCQIKRSRIDLSCVAVRSHIAKSVGFPFRNYDGDYDYIEACVEQAKREGMQVEKIDQVLCVHN